MPVFNRYNSVPASLPDKEFALVKEGDSFRWFIGDKNNLPIPSVGGTTKGKNLTGSTIDMSNIFGNNYNYASPLSADTYAFTGPVINGLSRCFINAPSQPVVTGATWLEDVGDVFVPSVTMEMVMESPNGIAVEYYFLRR